MLDILEIVNKLRRATSKTFKSIKLNDKFECTFWEPPTLGDGTYYIMSEQYPEENAKSRWCQEIDLIAKDITDNKVYDARLIYSRDTDLDEANMHNLTLYITDSKDFNRYAKFTNWTLMTNVVKAELI